LLCTAPLTCLCPAYRSLFDCMCVGPCPTLYACWILLLRARARLPLSSMFAHVDLCACVRLPRSLCLSLSVCLCLSLCVSLVFVPRYATAELRFSLLAVCRDRRADVRLALTALDVADVRCNYTRRQTQAHTGTHIGTHRHTHTHTHIQAHIQAHTDTHTGTCIHIQTHTVTHRHTQAHTDT
jgi:hypothetical protein